FQSDQKKELVSVIIPFYNNSVCTIKALESIKEQSYDFIEVILVNDGSTQIEDRLINYCEDNSIIIHSLPFNEGPASARNYGMKKAKGEYFAFLDSDDEFVKEKLCVQIAEMKKSGSYFSHSSYFRVIEGKKTIIDSGKENGFVLSKIIYNCPIATPTVVIHRKIFDDGFLFDPNFKYGEDICAWIEISKKYSLNGIDIPLTIVNVEKNSASQNVFKRTIGLSNIYNFIISDKDLRIFHEEIGLLLNKLSYHKKKYPYIEKLFLFFLKLKRIYLLEKILRMAFKTNHLIL
ncbi:MAG: glycosyltransferase family 2 protein, partial [Ignavibacteria bacterium]|nr:glycosyltransferase family 2 protein [Ignavibacteria bacterium]